MSPRNRFIINVSDDFMSDESQSKITLRRNTPKTIKDDINTKLNMKLKGEPKLIFQSADCEQKTTKLNCESSWTWNVMSGRKFCCRNCHVEVTRRRPSSALTISKQFENVCESGVAGSFTCRFDLEQKFSAHDSSVTTDYVIVCMCPDV